MLSIRTQDRMSLVPYDSVIYILKSDKKELIEKLYEKNCERININVEPTNPHYFDASMARKYAENNYRELDIRQIVCGDITLGTYKTKERALEVLDEIEEAILSQTKVFINEDGLEYHSISFTIIYEMPKE